MAVKMADGFGEGFPSLKDEKAARFEEMQKEMFAQNVVPATISHDLKVSAVEHYIRKKLKKAKKMKYWPVYYEIEGGKRVKKERKLFRSKSAKKRDEDSHKRMTEERQAKIEAYERNGDRETADLLREKKIKYEMITNPGWGVWHFIIPGVQMDKVPDSITAAADVNQAVYEPLEKDGLYTTGMLIKTIPEIEPIIKPRGYWSSLDEETAQATMWGPSGFIEEVVKDYIQSV